MPLNLSRYLRYVQALLSLVAFATASFPALAQSTPVGVDVVQRESLSQTIPVIGRLVSLQSGIIAVNTQGPVAKLQVEVGDHIQQGDLIAVLDQARLRAGQALQAAEIKELEARRATTEANEKLARLELNRLEKLRNTVAFNQSLYDSRVQELEVARSARQEAQARILRGRINLELAKIELKDSQIHAPFPGVVTAVHTSEGAWLDKGNSVITLLNDSRLEIEADVSATYVNSITVGKQIILLLEDGSRHLARVRSIIPDENSATRTRPVRLVPKFGSMGMALAINQPVTLLLPASDESQVVSVHKDAVLRKAGQASVFVVRDGVAQSRTVELGKAVGSRFQVLNGLQPGEVVVIRGNERLRSGQKVSYPHLSSPETEQQG